MMRAQLAKQKKSSSCKC